MAIHYLLKTGRRHRRELIIEMRIPASDQDTFTLQLPLWRPGRYERQQYERNIGFLIALDPEINIQRTSTHTWEISGPKQKEIRLSYTYFANRLDAGGSFTDTDLIYVNPVNCILYDPERPDLNCSLELELPDNFDVICALPREGNIWLAQSADQLFDSPLLASSDLQHHEFPVGKNNTMHLWFQGAHTLDFKKLEISFRAFSEAQIRLFGDMPCTDFHFLFLISEGRSYHGVEHPDSTVITLGPAATLLEGTVWNDLLSISSHELFHLWNVKRIRPADLFPYDYTKEQYSELHDITEGFTTYYGELMLVRSAVWTEEEWLFEMNDILNKHLDAPGKYSTPLNEASFLSWVNGYHTEGLPQQKISFYHKGALVAMLLDLTLRRQSNQTISLDKLLKRLYTDYQQKNYSGYSRADILNHLKEMGFAAADEFYQKYVAGLEDVFSALKEILPWAGMNLTEKKSDSFTKTNLGLKVSLMSENLWTVTGILPGSPAAETPLHIGDQIISIEDQIPGDNIDTVFRNISTQFEFADIVYISRGKTKKCQIALSTLYKDTTWVFEINSDADEDQINNRKIWLKG